MTAENLSTGSPRYFYEEFNLLRGVIIIFIVFQHFYWMFYIRGIKWITSWNHVWDLITGAFLFGGSWFFVFISGFLFEGVH